MTARNHGKTLGLALTATTLIGVLFAGGASAMADPESHRDGAEQKASIAKSGERIIGGRVGPILVPGEGDAERSAELRGRFIEGRVGYVLEQGQAD